MFMVPSTAPQQKCSKCFDYLPNEYLWSIYLLCGLTPLGTWNASINQLILKRENNM